MKIIVMKMIITLMSLLTINTYPEVNMSFNEEKIYYHLHQASYWAELYHRKNYYLASGEMDHHLSKVKYNNRRLVDSIFYGDFLVLLKNQQNLSKTTLPEIERLRKQLLGKAKKLNIKHSNRWKDEFLIVR